VLHGNKGDCCAAENYQPYRQLLGPGDARRFGPAGGRPTNGPNGWPYYNVQMPGGGLLLAVGWPGQWATAFVRDGKNGLRIVAGQELTHLSLRPGEEIRTPLAALLFWQGTDTIRAQNLWRRWFTAHSMPRRNGKPPEPFLTAAGNMGDVSGGESWYRNRIQTVNQAGLDWNLCWIDAGWYPCHGKWEETGTWEIDRARYPNGFRQVSDSLHAQGRRLTVWFEPERVRDPKSWLATHHPGWLLGFGTPTGHDGSVSAYWPQGWDKLLNLGDPSARAWATDHFDRMIKSQGIDIYRQDFNIEPLPYWRRNDPSDRQGITENFYVQGYLAYLDSLLARNPTIWSDVSASGGRRNDLETLRRALPLRRSDYEAPNGVPEAMQAQTYGLSSWLPYYGVLGQTFPLYSARSTYLPAIVFPSDFDTSAKGLADVKKVFEEYHQVAPIMLGDYYPLTDYSLQLDQWIAWQFDRPEQGDGVVQIFRRNKCPEASKTFLLHGLDAAARYEITDFDAASRSEVSGAELIEMGLTARIHDRPGATVMTYRRVGKQTGGAQRQAERSKVGLPQFVSKAQNRKHEGT
jgi:alpha-galactosidase